MNCLVIDVDGVGEEAGVRHKVAVQVNCHHVGEVPLRQLIKSGETHGQGACGAFFVHVQRTRDVLHMEPESVAKTILG